jgi:hypothetical protein
MSFDRLNDRGGAFVRSAARRSRLDEGRVSALDPRRPLQPRVFTHGQSPQRRPSDILDGTGDASETIE